jgi:6-phosphogluconate dehydrogenase
LDLGVAIHTIDAAIVARNISAQKSERVVAAQQFSAPPSPPPAANKQDMIDAVREALYASKICSYAQGMNVIKAASDQFGWKINLSETARIWQGGCIIRAKFLGLIKEAYLRQPDLVNLLLDNEFKSRIDRSQSSWRMIATHAIQSGLPIPAFAASLSYFDLYRSANLPLNLTQAQRDFFGSHTYERVDKPEQGFVHTEWEELLEKQKESR